MRILVEPSDYPELRNFGDRAMQSTAIRRIAEMFPKARIEVFADQPERLPEYAANVEGISTIGRNAWMSGLMPNRGILRPYTLWERTRRARHPEAAAWISSTLLNLRDKATGMALQRFLATTAETDLLIVCGMGGITDMFERYALDLLDTIDLIKRNKNSVVAMFGQGIGPIAPASVVFCRASEVLPKVDLIALRESRSSMPILESLGVSQSRIRITGDDALELATQNRQSEIGRCLGVNVRVATYSGVTNAHVSQLRYPIQHFASTLGAPIVSLPSSIHPDEADQTYIQSIVEGYNNLEHELVSDSEGLIECVQKSRIAIVGSYHAAVYALAQGVPIVGLYNNPYYRDKFLGLESLFGPGVFPVNLSTKDWTLNLIDQATVAWERAPKIRKAILESVDRQILAGQAAYESLCEMFECER